MTNDKSQWHENVKSDPKRRQIFEAMVLQALWVLILCAFGRKPREHALAFRADAIDYMDVHGNQSDDSRKYRREHTYAPLDEAPSAPATAYPDPRADYVRKT